MDISVDLTTNDGGTTEVYRINTIYSQVQSWFYQDSTLIVRFEVKRTLYINLNQYLKVDIKEIE